MSIKEWLSRYPTLYAKYYRICGDAESRAAAETLRKELDAIENAINAIDDPQCRVAMTLRYTDGPTGRLMRWRDVAFAMYHNDSDADLLRVHRLHKKALDMVKLPTR